MRRTRIEIWHGFGNITAHVTHDGENGNAATSSFEIDFGESDLPSVHLERSHNGQVQRLAFSINGSCERQGLGWALQEIGGELLKPADKLGETIQIGYEPLDDELPQASISEKGKKGELALNAWLQSVGISYLYVNQDPESFARLFKGNAKRPDFLVLLESIGMIAVDAKNYTVFNGEYSLPLETELRRVLTFERLFRIPVWYAYLGLEDGKEVWYWISALKALEVGDVRTNSGTKEEFLAIKIHHFERIENGNDLGKLYTHRLPSLKRIAREP